MLRIGLTGGLGSGKSTVAHLLATHGAHILQADEIGRDLMQPGRPVFDAIVDRFGREVVSPDGTLDRPALARMAFAGGRLDELNAIVHPATIARQAELAQTIAAKDPNAVLVVESALIFETKYAGPRGWQDRFDRIVLVTTSEERKIARFVARSGGKDVPALEAEARRRLATQIPDAEKILLSDYILTNDGDLPSLESQVDALWLQLISVEAGA
jgi:dephospho-CoA kinase